jgi:hypothetical protein
VRCLEDHRRSGEEGPARGEAAVHRGGRVRSEDEHAPGRARSPKQAIAIGSKARCAGKLLRRSPRARRRRGRAGPPCARARRVRKRKTRVVPAAEPGYWEAPPRALLGLARELSARRRARERRRSGALRSGAQRSGRGGKWHAVQTYALNWQHALLDGSRPRSRTPPPRRCSVSRFDAAAGERGPGGLHEILSFPQRAARAHVLHHSSDLCGRDAAHRRGRINPTEQKTSALTTGRTRRPRTAALRARDDERHAWGASARDAERVEVWADPTTRAARSARSGRFLPCRSRLERRARLRRSSAASGRGRGGPALRP